ncbi:SUMF1/EgtB/PvdO family nonheme iron enzyme [Nostoc sp. UIC 10607]|uniref:SUMF1/EgtB/PvdO family nonheme iron enzyme n=1 Tax=Nostoc sp. UIC 10607 TaxID=3045935 RepID=UPI0039A221AE
MSLKVFISYSHADESLKNELVNHLTTSIRQCIISTWDAREIPPGGEWDRQIKENLNTADIILLLVSSDFIRSEYCWSIEVTKAVERHEAKEACVIPIILRSVDWENAPFAQLQALPQNTLPVRSWNNQDDAFKNVAQGIRFAANKLIEERQQQQLKIEAAIAQYRQRAEYFTSDGKISPLELDMLNDLQKNLGLTDSEASTIRKKALDSYRIYREKIEIYRLSLINFINEQGYPLDGNAERELKEFQQHYKLKHEDIVRLRETELFTALEIVAIPGGKFLMGSLENEPGRLDRESPQHLVTIQPFFMGKYPVTQSQWAVVAALKEVNNPLNPDPSRFKGANRPVERVSWYDAIEFCARLSKKTGKTYRLPSEAEWEYACRAGTTTPFYFSETITTDLANYDGNYTYSAGTKGEYRQQTTDVGKFPPNSFALFDMHGNIWEWCQDAWHENYNGAPTDGSAWISENDERLLRGGSWSGFPRFCRSANRYWRARGGRYDYVGFRVVVAAPFGT